MLEVDGNAVEQRSSNNIIPNKIREDMFKATGLKKILADQMDIQKRPRKGHEKSANFRNDLYNGREGRPDSN